MPTKQPITRNLPAIMERPMREIMLFAWVDSRLKLSPSFSMKMSVEAFMERYGISEDDWPLQTALISVYKNFCARFNICDEVTKVNFDAIVQAYEKKLKEYI
jgi:hypothetical protein